MCWSSTDDGSGSCTAEIVTIPSRGLVIPDLKPGTMYVITVSAFTKVGEGPAISVRKETDKSGK